MQTEQLFQDPHEKLEQEEAQQDSTAQHVAAALLAAPIAGATALYLFPLVLRAWFWLLPHLFQVVLAALPYTYAIFVAVVVASMVYVWTDTPNR